MRALPFAAAVVGVFRAGGRGLSAPEGSANASQWRVPRPMIGWAIREWRRALKIVRKIYFLRQNLTGIGHGHCTNAFNRLLQRLTTRIQQLARNIEENSRLKKLFKTFYKIKAIKRTSKHRYSLLRHITTRRTVGYHKQCWSMGDVLSIVIEVVCEKCKIWYKKYFGSLIWILKNFSWRDRIGNLHLFLPLMMSALDFPPNSNHQLFFEEFHRPFLVAFRPFFLGWCLSSSAIVPDRPSRRALGYSPKCQIAQTSMFCKVGKGKSYSIYEWMIRRVRKIKKD